MGTSPPNSLPSTHFNHYPHATYSTHSISSLHSTSSTHSPLYPLPTLPMLHSTYPPLYLPSTLTTLHSTYSPIYLLSTLPTLHTTYYPLPTLPATFSPVFQIWIRIKQDRLLGMDFDVFLGAPPPDLDPDPNREKLGPRSKTLPISHKPEPAPHSPLYLLYTQLTPLNTLTF